METLTLSQIADLMNGKLNNKKYADILVNNYSIDTRTLSKGDIYIPIIGEKFDGHQFINEAFEKGAIASVSNYGAYDGDYKACDSYYGACDSDYKACDSDYEVCDSDYGACDSDYEVCGSDVLKNDDNAIIYVENSNNAFQLFAKNYKELCNTKVVAITGSNGKTTTKDLINSVLEKNFNTKKTIGNLNNEIGVPKTLLTFNKSTDVGIVEMGTDGFGQIEVLSKIASPDIAIITNIGDSHLEQLKTKENIAKEKLHIVDHLKNDGIFIYNNDDEILTNTISQAQIYQKTISFGTKKNSDYIIKILHMDNDKSTFKLNNKEYIIPLIGKHQVYNASIAIIVAKLFNISYKDIIDGLSKKEITSMRSELIKLDDFDILNDSYKSNPQSLISALDTIYALKGYDRKIAVLGDMLELGDNEINLHKNIGKYLNPEIIDYVLLYGPLSKYIYDEASKNFDKNNIYHFNNKEELIKKTKTLIISNSLVLVKASRSLKLEEVVNEISNI